MSFGVPLVRERRRQVPDPYNPARTSPAPWDDNPDRLEFCGFVSSSSSSPAMDAARSDIDSIKFLYTEDPATDIRAGDRVIHPDGIGYVRSKPSADINPWTGWQPTKEIRLYETEG
jgi:hypothetical protein